MTLLGAALSGLPSLAAVLVDVHWAGTPLSLLLFGPGAAGSPRAASAGRAHRGR